jgi:hypothetical protein
MPAKTSASLATASSLISTGFQLAAKCQNAGCTVHSPTASQSQADETFVLFSTPTAPAAPYTRLLLLLLLLLPPPPPLLLLPLLLPPPPRPQRQRFALRRLLIMKPPTASSGCCRVPQIEQKGSIKTWKRLLSVRGAALENFFSTAASTRPQIGILWSRMSVCC